MVIMIIVPRMAVNRLYNHQPAERYKCQISKYSVYAFFVLKDNTTPTNPLELGSITMPSCQGYHNQSLESDWEGANLLEDAQGFLSPDPSWVESMLGWPVLPRYVGERCWKQTRTDKTSARVAHITSWQNIDNIVGGTVYDPSVPLLKRYESVYIGSSSRWNHLATLAEQSGLMIVTCYMLMGKNPKVHWWRWKSLVNPIAFDP